MGSCSTQRYGDTHAGFVRHAQKVGTIFFVCVAIWAAAGFGSFWPMWVALFFGFKLASHARRVYRDRYDDRYDDAEPEFTVV